MLLPLLAALNGMILYPASDPHICYEGRTVARSDGSVAMGYPGVTAVLRVAGNNLSLSVATFKGRQYLDVSVDGGGYRQVELRPGLASYPIALTGDGPHAVTIVRCNESWQGTLEFKSFAVAGKLLDPPVLPARKLMFVGDSVTCGEVAAYHPGTDFGDALNTDARISYGMLLAGMFHAQCELVSYGGRGILRDWQGIRKTNNAPQFYELALPDAPASLWNARRYVPDAIGVQLGTNDFSSGIPDEVEFVDAYVEFVRTLRRDAPGAFIFLMESPILDGQKRAVLHSYLEEVVALLQDAHVQLASVRHRPGVPGNGHPTGAEHQAMAEELEPVLRSAMGW